MEVGTIRKLRYLLLAVVCIVLTLSISYLNPDLLPHRVRQMTQSAPSAVLPPPIKTIHPKPLYVADTASKPPSVTSTAVQTVKVETTKPPGRKLNIVQYDKYPVKTEIECVPLRTALHGAKICIHPVHADIHVSGMLKRAGVWEPHIVGPVKTQLEKCPECQFIDVGANIGVFTLSVASMGRKVIAVEPLNANLLRLTKAIKLNGMQQTITTVANPVSDVYENVSFWQPKDNAGGTHAASQSITNFDRRIFNKAADVVPTIHLDDLMQVIKFKKAVMKIDIEGYEPRAFKVADKLFDAVEIHYVFMEWGTKGNSDRNYVQPMLEFFSKRGFKPHDGGFHPLNAANQPLTFERTKGWPFDIIWIKP